MATALDLYQPFDAGAGANVTEDNFRKQFRHYLETGVLSGEDNELQMYGDSSGRQFKIKTGKCIVRSHYGENATEKTLATDVNTSGNPRIDRGILRADFTNNRIELDVLKGTPAGSPAPPAVTQNSSIWEVPLGQVLLANGYSTIAAGDVTDERDALWLFGTRNVAYRSYTPILKGTATPFTLGNGSLAGRWRRDGRKITGKVSFTMGSTSVAPAGTLVVTVPVPGEASAVAQDPVIGHLAIKDASPVAFYYRVPAWNSGLTSLIFYTEAGVVTTTNGAPITLATGDVLTVTFQYEAAS